MGKELIKEILKIAVFKEMIKKLNQIAIVTIKVKQGEF